MGEWETEAKGGALRLGFAGNWRPQPGQPSDTHWGPQGTTPQCGWGWEGTSQKHEEPFLLNLGAPTGKLCTSPTSQVSTTPLKGAETHLNTK